MACPNAETSASHSSDARFETPVSACAQNHDPGSIPCLAKNGESHAGSLGWLDLGVWHAS